MHDPPELGRVTSRRPPFKYSALSRVWFSDTDAQGVVYYGRYLPYFDHARTEYHRHLGGGERRRRRVRHARVARSSTTRRRRFDDLIESFVRVRRIGTLEHDVRARRVSPPRRHAHGHCDADARPRRSRRAAGRPRSRSTCARRSARSREATSRSEHRALEALDRILNREGEPDDVLRAALDVLAEEPAIDWAVGRPSSRTARSCRARRPGAPGREPPRSRVPIAFQGAPVGELRVDGAADPRSSTASPRSSPPTS